MARNKRKPQPAAQRNRPGEGNWRTRPNGSLEWRVPVGETADGKTFIKSFYGRTEEEARASHAVWAAAHPHGPPTPQEAAPFNDLLAAWVESEIKPPMRKQGTYEDYLNKIDNHISATLGLRITGEIRHHHIMGWLRTMAAKGRGRTTEKCLEIVKQAFAYGVKNQIITTNPAANVEAPAYERRRAQPLTVPQFRALLEAAGGRVDRRKPYATADGKVKRYPPIETRLEVLYIILLYVGLRRGEVLGLKWGDIVDGVLHIQRQIDDEGRVWAYTKGDANNREVELSDLVQEALGAHQVRMQAEDHDEARKPDGWIFPTAAGTPMRPSNLTKHFKNVLAAAGLSPTVRLHDLRHTTGSTAAAAGVATAAITALLGHASTAITQKLYIHGDGEGTKGAMEGVRRRVKGEG
jgi:integrase